MWVSRNKNGSLIICTIKPHREQDSYWCTYQNNQIPIPRESFPDLKWEDEPIEVKLVEVENKTKQDKDCIEKVCKNCQFYREVPACYDSKGFCKDWKLSTYIINQMKKDKKE